MRVSKEGKAFFIEAEGYRENMYRDSAGYWTIGIGHKMTPSELSTGKIYISGLPFQYSKGLPSDAVHSLFKQDLKRFEDAINNYVKVPLRQNQFDALVSLAFNIGVGAFLGSTLLRLLNEQKYSLITKEMKKWRKAGGQIVQGLVNRREKEIKLWESV